VLLAGADQAEVTRAAGGHPVPEAGTGVRPGRWASASRCRQVGSGEAGGEEVSEKSAVRGPFRGFGFSGGVEQALLGPPGTGWMKPG